MKATLDSSIKKKGFGLDNESQKWNYKSIHWNLERQPFCKTKKQQYYNIWAKHKTSATDNSEKLSTTSINLRITAIITH